MSGRARITVGAFAAAVAVAVVVMFASGGDEDPHYLTLQVPRATHYFSGLDVRAAGQKVGEITETEVTGDHQARMRVRIDDPAAWPLPEGTRGQLRWGGTIKFIARYVELLPPAAAKGRPMLAEGGRLLPTAIPQEFDQVFSIFDARTRREMRATLRAAGPSLQYAQPGLAATLDKAPPALEQARAVLDDVNADHEALTTLIRSADSVVGAIRASEPDVGRLVTGAGTTFRAVADQSRDLQRTFDALPGMLRTTQHTLDHADGTLATADALLTDLDPGTAGLRRLAPSVTSLLRRALSVAPDATTSLRTLRRATPELDALLAQTRRTLPALSSSGRELAEQLSCVRPYAPEVAGLASTWSGWFGHKDGKDHYIRAEVATTPWTNDDPRTPQQLHEHMPSITSAFPRPPGHLVGRPWFQPQCGITEEALDPAKDPEAREYDPTAPGLIEITEGDDGVPDR